MNHITNENKMHFADAINNQEKSSTYLGRLQNYADYYVSWSGREIQLTPLSEMGASLRKYSKASSFSIWEKGAFLLILPPLFLFFVKVLSRRYSPPIFDERQASSIKKSICSIQTFVRSALLRNAALKRVSAKKTASNRVQPWNQVLAVGDLSKILFSFLTPLEQKAFGSTCKDIQTVHSKYNKPHFDQFQVVLKKSIERT